MAAFARAGGYCEQCRVRKGVEYHHLIPVEQGIEFNYPPEQINAVDNCILVCNDCHRQLDN